MKRKGLIVLTVLLCLATSCHSLKTQRPKYPEKNCNDATLYYQLWLETEEELRQCIQNADSLID